MSAAGARITPEDCRHARLHIGADPQGMSAEVAAHVATCAGCQRFREEMLMLDGKVHAALELPLRNFRRPAQPARRFALAASVVLALILGGGFWLFRPATALAGAVVEHVADEAGSWDMHEPLPPAEIAGVLRTAGVQFDSPLPIVYAYPCPFQGSRIAHLVVQTGNGTMTIMLIPHEQVRRRTEFSQNGMRGVLLPAGRGSVALLTRDGAVPEALAEEIVSRVRW
jgi:Protein of unknown function (DUF3379)